MIRQGIKRITSLALITSMIACTFPYASVPVHAQTQMDGSCDNNSGRGAGEQAYNQLFHGKQGL